MHKVKFSYSILYCDRRHYINKGDVRVILNRLPYELWHMLKGVHFNDQSHGGKTLGYVNLGHREIAICALPPRMSLKWARSAGDPNQYGAIKGAQWPTLAIRRYQLYYTFLHELGHLQIILPNKSNPNRKYAGETKTHLFTNYWRKKLWAEKFDHPDPVHNPPTDEELNLLKRCWVKAHLLYKKGHNFDMSNDIEKAMMYYLQAIQIYPNHTQALERIGMLTYNKNEHNDNVESLRQVEGWLKHALSIDPLLPHARQYLELVQKRL